MPSIRDSVVPVDSSRYQNVEQPSGSVQMQNAPIQPTHLKPSPVMICSLPSISTSVDGITRQFYGRGNLPIRRIVSPSS